MRTKVLLSTVAAGLFGFSAMAQVVSVNVVGFVNVTLTNGFNLICNPLNAGANNISTILPAPSDVTTVTIQQWDANPSSPTFQSFKDPITYIPGVGWDIDATINPGEAFFVNVDRVMTLTFVGEVRQAGTGTLTTPLVAGFNFVGSQTPLGDPNRTDPALGGLTTALSFTPSQTGVDTVQQWVAGAQGYKDPSAYIPGVGWDSEPVLAIADGIIINRDPSGGTSGWTSTFNVAP